MGHMFPGQLWTANSIKVIRSCEAISAVYSQGQVKLGQKGQIFNFIKVNKNEKVSFRCSMSSEIRWCILFGYATSGTCSNIHLNYQHSFIISLTRIQKNEMSYKSVIFYISGWHFQACLEKISSRCCLRHTLRFFSEHQNILEKKNWKFVK